MTVGNAAYFIGSDSNDLRLAKRRGRTGRRLERGTSSRSRDDGRPAAAVEADKLTAVGNRLVPRPIGRGLGVVGQRRHRGRHGRW